MRIKTKERLLKLLLPLGNYIVARSKTYNATFEGPTVFAKGILKKANVLRYEWELGFPVHLVAFKTNSKGQNIIRRHTIMTNIFKKLINNDMLHAVLIEKWATGTHDYYFRFGLTKKGREQAEKEVSNDGQDTVGREPK